MATKDAFRGIHVFMEVVDTGSFTRAAERLDMTKSGVSKSISRLEQDLAVRLFQRTTRRLSLTDEGRRFNAAAKRALTEIDEAQALFSPQRAQLSGSLRISLPVIFGKHWVLPLLLEVAGLQPALELDIQFTDRMVDLVEDGVDLAIRIGPLPDSATLVAKPLGVQQAMLCASPAYLAQRGSPQTLADLSRHSCITFGSGGLARPWHFQDRQGRRHAIEVRGQLGMNDSEAITSAALAGLGIALIADWLIAAHLQSGKLVQLLPAAQPQGFPVYAVWQKNQYLSPKVKYIVDLLAARFMQQPWTPG